MIEDLSRDQRTGLFVAIIFTMIVTVAYITFHTLVEDTNYKYIKVMKPNGHVLFFGIISIIWISVVVALKLDIGLL